MESVEGDRKGYWWEVGMVSEGSSGGLEWGKQLHLLAA